MGLGRERRSRSTARTGFEMDEGPGGANYETLIMQRVTKLQATGFD